jgi:hypothetical protein
VVEIDCVDELFKDDIAGADAGTMGVVGVDVDIVVEAGF